MSEGEHLEASSCVYFASAGLAIALEAFETAGTLDRETARVLIEEFEQRFPDRRSWRYNLAEIEERLQ